MRALVLLLVACGPSVRDVRVAVPKVDPLFIDLVSPELVIEPGSEKMWCAVVQYQGEATAFKGVESLQGKFGHHVIPVTPDDVGSAKVGDVFDCTRMSNLAPFAIPIDELPAGYGAKLDANQVLVMQLHYVNAGREPLRVRDVIRLKKEDPANVKTWVAPAVFAGLGFNVPAGAQGTSYTFDCTVSEDVDLLMAFGHMHENGASFRTDLSGALLHTVPQWHSHYRDSPPVDMYMTEPKHVKKGEIVTTTCTWNNATDHAFEHPEEMCVSTWLVAGTDKPIVCKHGELR